MVYLPSISAEGPLPPHKHTRGATILHPLNVLTDAPELLAIIAEHDLASICSGPLAMGLLSGKFDTSSRLPTNDVRGSGHDWVEYFEDGRPRPEYLDALALICEVLRSGDRTLAQRPLLGSGLGANTRSPSPASRL